MNTNQIDKESYRTIIQNYFRAFGTRDFSQVQFSSKIQFLSPISGITMKGKEDVTNFVTSLSTRVAQVTILHTCVDYPNASGVWQMLTTKGVLYTLHNYFRLAGNWWLQPTSTVAATGIMYFINPAPAKQRFGI